MKAVRFHKEGSPDVLQYEDTPAPSLEKDGLLVEVHAVGINPLDYKVRRGSRNLDKPFILGWDVSGVVVESANPDFKIGDAVYGMMEVGEEGKTYAEFVSAPAAWFAHKPQSLNHIEAAAVPLVALTALQALDHAKAQAGQSILINAAAGGVGHMAVQLAKLHGLQVIATASAHNHEFLYGLGAYEVIDYRAQAIEELVQGVDIVLEPIDGTNGQRLMKSLRDGGTMVTISSGTEVYSERDIRIIAMQEDDYVKPNAAQLRQIAEWLDTGKLCVSVEQVWPLAQAAEAHHKIEAGHVRGKLVLQVVE
jgi:NADPH:quinone reductase-like Zn-dependent oxidoreductase